MTTAGSANASIRTQLVAMPTKAPPIPASVNGATTRAVWAASRMTATTRLQANAKFA